MSSPSLKPASLLPKVDRVLAFRFPDEPRERILPVLPHEIKDCVLYVDGGVKAGEQRERTSEGGRGIPYSGACLSFDGVGDNVNFGNDTSLRGTGEHTICGWVRCAAAQNSKALFARFGASGNRSFRVITDSSGAPRFQISTTGSDTWSSSVCTTLLDGDDWYHLAVVYNPNTYVHIYVNGVREVNDTSSIPASIYDSTADVFAGAWETGSSGNIDGELADWAIYLDLASASEIAWAYKNRKLPHQAPGALSVASNLKGYWPMDEAFNDGGFTDIYDHSGNDNTGTVSGAAPIVGEADIPQLSQRGFNQNTTIAAPDTVIVSQMADNPQLDALGNAITNYQGMNFSGDVAGGSIQLVDNDGSTPIANDIFAGGGTAYFWCKALSLGEVSFGRLVTKSAWQMYLDSESGNTCLIRFQHSFDSQIGRWNTTNRVVTYGTPLCVVVTYNRDAVGNNAQFYIDGQSVATNESQVPIGTAVVDTSDVAAISGLYAWDGAIYECALYDRILLQNEIKMLYESTKGLYS